MRNIDLKEESGYPPAFFTKIVYPETAFPMVLLGTVFGASAVFLSLKGNPVNTGLCVSCFMVNVAGALGLHGTQSSAYLRPEILAIVIGAFAVAYLTGEFRSRGSSVPVLKFAGGAFLIFGCEVFIGCPIKMLLRLSAGSATAVAGAAGLAGGAVLGALYVKEGFSLFVQRKARDLAGAVSPLAAFSILFISSSGIYAFASGFIGSSARHAPFALSLLVGVLMGALGQRSRFCITGSVEKGFLGKVFIDVGAVGGFLLGAFLLNAATGGFRPAYLFEPGAHTDLLWAFLSLGMVGFGAILIGGCPFRQLVLSGEGDLGAFWAVTGMLAGAALSVHLGVSSSAEGVTVAGKIAVLMGWIFFLTLALLGTRRSQR